MWAEAIALGAIAALGYYVGKPLFEDGAETGASLSEPATPEDRKLQVYEALSDLEYDFHLQKISPADYQRLKASLTREALEILAASRPPEKAPAQGCGCGCGGAREQRRG